MLKRSFMGILLLSLVLSLAVPLVYGGMDSLRPLEQLPLWGLGLLAAMAIVSWLFDATRLRLLVGAMGPRLPAADATAIIVSRDFADMTTPGGAGGPAALVLLLTRKGLSGAQGAAALAVLTLSDLVFFVTLIPLVVLLPTTGSGIHYPLTVVALMIAMIATAVALALLAARYYRPLLLGLGRLLHHFPRVHRFRYRLARAILQFRHAVGVLLRLPSPRLLLLYALTVAYWLTRYGILPAIVWLLDQSIPWTYLLLIQPLLLVAARLVFLPGGGGGVEMGYALLMQSYMTPTLIAFTLLAWRFFTFYWNLIIGAPVFLIYAGRAAWSWWRSGSGEGGPAEGK